MVAPMQHSAYAPDMITAGQIRAARALIGWKQTELAKAAGISEISIKNIEREVTDSRSSTLSAIQAAFEKAGVVFLEPGDTRDGGPGVRLKPKRRLTCSPRDWEAGQIGQRESCSPGNRLTWRGCPAWRRPQSKKSRPDDRRPALQHPRRASTGVREGRHRLPRTGRCSGWRGRVAARSRPIGDRMCRGATNPHRRQTCLNTVSTSGKILNASLSSRSGVIGQRRVGKSGAQLQSARRRLRSCPAACFLGDQGPRLHPYRKRFPRIRRNSSMNRSAGGSKRSNKL